MFLKQRWHIQKLILIGAVRMIKVVDHVLYRLKAVLQLSIVCPVLHLCTKLRANIFV